MRRLIDQDRGREARRQQRLLQIAERRFARMFARILRQVSREMVEEYRRTKGEPKLPDDAYRRVGEAFAGMVQAVAAQFGQRVLDQGKSAGYAIERKDFAEFFARVTLEYIAQEAVRRRITSITETTRTQIIRQIRTGQSEGQGVETIADNIVSVVGSISKVRGALIARTETHAAANAGADQAARATNIPLKKEWVSVSDHRTRDSDDDFDHAAADGQVVEMDQPFRIPKSSGGFELLMFPGDPAGSPGNVINCRCSVAHIVVE